MIETFKRYWWVIAGIVLLWAMPFVLHIFVLSDAQREQFGDMFGALNTLFSGLAFAFVIIALLQQQRQFESRAFETGFFELLKLFRQNVASMQYSSQGRLVTGKLVFNVLKSELEKEFRKIAVGEGDKYSKENVKAAYSCFYKKCENQLGDYFRLLFHLMQHIKDAKCLTDREKRRYGNMVRAGLNSNELFLLFFNGVSDVGEGARDYICRFHMFEHLELDWLEGLIPDGLYPPSAFGSNKELKKT